MLPKAVSENNSSPGILSILKKNEQRVILSNIFAGKLIYDIIIFRGIWAYFGLLSIYTYTYDQCQLCILNFM